MSDTFKIYCKNLSRYVDFSGGETLGEVLSRIAPELDFKPLCALVNYRAEDLHYPLFGPKIVEFMPLSTPAGRTACIHSLCFLLYAATRRVCPEAKLIIEHSISKGYYCRLENAPEITSALIGKIEEEMRRLVDADIPFQRKERPRRLVIDRFREQGLDDKADLLETISFPYIVYYKLGDLIDSYFGPLVPSTGYLKVFSLEKYHEGFLLLGPSPSCNDIPQQPVTQEKMQRAFDEHLAFNRIIGVSNVGQLNRTVIKGDATDLINVAEALHEKKISQIADRIAERYHQGGARVVLIAGPSSSGKTTTAKRLAIFLMTNLLKPKLISLDNYFVDRTLTPRDETGDYDYESLYALDLELFNRNLNDLIAGKTVDIPTYNFETGKREFLPKNRLHLEENSILLIEGIHGLNPDLTPNIEERMKFRVYVSALTTLAIDNHNWIPTTDNRLLRRIIRDYKYRGTSAEDTIKRWPSVRRGEEKWIFPYQENADATFNSSLIFELGVMRDYALDILKNVGEDTPEFTEADRLTRFLSLFRPIRANQVPPTSLLREFLGGSSFHY